MKEAKPRQGPRALSSLVGRVLDPVTARRGFATADLLANWAEIVGPAFADCTQPERLAWPRSGGSATLTVRVAGARAVLLMHDRGPFLERINAFLGYGAVAELRIVQRPLEPARAGSVPVPPRPLSPAGARALDLSLEGIDGALALSLRRLGEAVLGSALAQD